MIARFLMVGALVTVPFAAQAGLEICNATKVNQSIAIGYKSGDVWVSEGWWQAAPGACATPVTSDLKNRYYYIHTQAEGREFQFENYSFCTTQEEFTIKGDTECAARGYDKTFFIELDTGETATHFTKSITDQLSVPSARDDTSGGSRDGSAKGPGASAVAESSGGPGDGLPTNPVARTAPDPTPDPAPGKSLDTGRKSTPPPTEPVAGFVDGVLSTGLQSGANGEPFRENGLFQGCGSSDGQRFCAFHVNGWKYFAYVDDPTPAAALEPVRELAVNTPVEIEGDLRFYGDITAEIAIRTLRLRPGGDGFADLRADIQGAWVSLDDRQAKMSIEGSESTAFYGEDVVGERYLQIADSCEMSHGAGPVLIETDPAERTPQCYLIARADGDSLDLIYMARGNTLRYARP